LPKFGGHGTFGDHVFEAELASGESESGVSVHLVDDNCDTGRVVRQVRVPVKSTDSVESLKARTRVCEREVLQSFAAIAAGELQVAAPG
jgi:phosphoribosylglycinamide formyltransferase-1